MAKNYVLRWKIRFFGNAKVKTTHTRPTFRIARSSPPSLPRTFVPAAHLALPGRGRGAPRPGARPPAPLAPARGLLRRVARPVLLRRLGEEVGGHQAPHPVDLAHVEAVVVHLAVHVDDLARGEAQFYLQLGRNGFGRVLGPRRPRGRFCFIFFSMGLGRGRSGGVVARGLSVVEGLLRQEFPTGFVPWKTVVEWTMLQ